MDPTEDDPGIGYAGPPPDDTTQSDDSGGTDSQPIGNAGPPPESSYATDDTPPPTENTPDDAIGYAGPPPDTSASSDESSSIGTAGPPPEEQHQGSGGFFGGLKDFGKNVANEVARTTFAGPKAVYDAIGSDKNPLDDPGGFLQDANAALQDPGAVLKDAFTNEAKGYGNIVTDATGVGSRMLSNAAVFENDLKNGTGSLSSDANPINTGLYAITGNKSPMMSDTEFNTRNVVSQNPLGAVLPGMSGSGEGPQVVPEGVPVIGGDSLYDLPLVGGLARAGKAIVGSASDDARYDGPSIDVGGLERDLDNGMPLQQAEEKYKGSVGARILSDLANPVNFAEVPGMSEVIKQVFTTKTAGELALIDKAASSAKVWDSSFSQGAEDALKKRGPIFDQDASGAAQTITRTMTDLAPGINEVANAPSAAAAFYDGAARLASKDTDGAVQVAQRIAETFGGGLDGNLDYMQKLVEGVKYGDKTGADASKLLTSTAEKLQNHIISDQELGEAAQKLGIDLRQASPKEVQAATAQAAKDTFSSDIRAAWYEKAGTKLPENASQIEQGIQGIFSTVRGLLLAASAPPLALQKFTDEWFRALTQGTLGVRASDTAIGQAVGRFGEKNNLFGAGDKFNNFRQAGTVNSILNEGMLPPTTALRDAKSAYRLGDAFTGKGRYGQDLTTKDKFGAVAGAPIRALTKWNDALIQAPTQHVILNALHQDTKGIKEARAAIAMQARDAVLSSGNPDANYVAAVVYDRLVGAQSQSEFLRIADELDNYPPTYGIGNAAHSITGPGTLGYAGPPPTQLSPPRALETGDMSQFRKASEIGVPGPPQTARAATNGRVVPDIQTMSRDEYVKAMQRGYAPKDMGDVSQGGTFGKRGNRSSTVGDLAGLEWDEAHAAGTNGAAPSPDALKAERHQLYGARGNAAKSGNTSGVDETNRRLAGYGSTKVPEGTSVYTPETQRVLKAAEQIEAANGGTFNFKDVGGLNGHPDLRTKNYAEYDKLTVAKGELRNQGLIERVGSDEYRLTAKGREAIGAEPRVAEAIGHAGPPPETPLPLDQHGPAQQFAQDKMQGIMQGAAVPVDRVPIGQAGPPIPGVPTRGAQLPDFATAAQSVRQAGTDFAAAGRNATQAGVARGQAIVGNNLDQTTAGSWMKNGIGGVTPPVLPFAPFHIHSAQFWGQYFAAHPALAYGMAQVLDNLDDYGTLKLPNGTTVSGLIKLTTGLHIVEWAKKAYEYQTDLAAAGNNNPLQQAMKGLNYNLAGENAFVRPFEFISGPAASLTQRTTNPLYDGIDKYTGAPKVDKRDILKEYGSLSGTSGVGETLNDLTGAHLPRGLIQGATNPGQFIGNQLQGLTDKTFGVDRKPYQPELQDAYTLGIVAEKMGLSKYQAEKAYYKPETPQEIALGQQLHDAVHMTMDTKAIGKLAPVQTAAKEPPGIFQPKTDRALMLDQETAPGMTMSDLLKQPGNYYDTLDKIGAAEASGNTQLKSDLLGTLKGIREADIQSDPRLKSYFDELNAATKAKADTALRATMTDAEQKAYDAFNDLRASAGYKQYEEYGKAIHDLPPKGTKEYTDWWRQNGDKYFSLTNTINAAEQSIVDRYHVNPKELQNRVQTQQGYTPSYADTTIKPQTTVSGNAGSGNSGTGRAASTVSSSGRNYPSSGTGSRGNSSFADTKALGDSFFTEWRGLTAKEKATLGRDPVVAHALSGGNTRTARDYEKAIAVVEASRNKAQGGTPAPGTATTGERFQRHADQFVSNGVGLTPQQLAAGIDSLNGGNPKYISGFQERQRAIGLAGSPVTASYAPNLGNQSKVTPNTPTGAPNAPTTKAPKIPYAEFIANLKKKGK